jgi:hypothetical protein
MASVLPVPGFLVVSLTNDNKIVVFTASSASPPLTQVGTPLDTVTSMGGKSLPYFMASRPANRSVFHVALYSSAVWELSVSASGALTVLGQRIAGGAVNGAAGREAAWVQCPEQAVYAE